MPRDLQSTLNSVDDVDIQNSEGDTALHYATRNGRLEIAEYLLSGGADHTIQNNKKETPLDCLLKKHEPQELLDLAIQKGFLKLAELSIDAGADVNLINRDEKFTSPLSEAVENNNLAVVQLLVGRRANIRFTASKDSNMVNMLHLATSNCNLEMMKFFIEKGLDVNETDFYDDTTLHTVIKSSTNKKDKLASVELLLANGADISAIGDERKTPLQLAEEKGYADIVDILRNKIKLQKEKKLFAAAEKGDFECVKKAIELDTNINIQDKYGYTPLFVAADNGYENIVKLLIEKGADVNLRANNSYTPLLIAASKGYENIIKLLTDKKEIDVNAKTNSGDTSLFLAATYGYENIVKLLINKGANVNVEVNSQWARWTPLLFVIHKGYKNIAKLLIKGEACINAQDEDGKTPLHYAAQNGRLEIVKLLLENGADVNAKNKYGEAILHFVIVEGNLEIAKLLLEHGANINYQGSYNDTALHEAIKNRHRDITEYLINIEDINLNLQNKEGKTPLHLAVLYGYSEIVRLLVEKKSSLDIQDKFGQTAFHIAINRGRAEVAQLIIQHILAHDHKADKPDFLQGKYLAYWDECEKMQKHKIGNSKISFFDILAADKKKLAPCVNDYNVVKALDAYDCEKKFPIYADKIKRQYTKGMNEKVAADIILNLSKNEDGDNVLVEDASRMVFNLLDYKEIRNLCKAGYQELIKKRHTNTEAAPERPVEDDKTVNSRFSGIRLEEHGKCVTQQNKT